MNVYCQVYFVVMINIFYPGERIQQRYDIKGCQIGRFTKPEENDSNVVVILKEKNLKDGKIMLGKWVFCMVPKYAVAQFGVCCSTVRSVL